LAELIAALALFVGPNPPYVLPSVAYGDAQHAWAGTATGIYATADGGAHWRSVSRSEGAGLVAVDATHAWALGANGVTVRTTDGVSWRSLGVQHLLRLSFVDRRNGFALGRDDFVLRTQDAGATWAPVRGPQRLQSLCFGSATTGWVARGGTVWTTADAGVHWHARTLIKGAIPDLYCRGNDVWAVFHEGAAAGTEGYDVFASFDAGRTWHERYASPFVRGMPHVSNYSGPVAALGGGDAVLEGSCSPCGNGYGTVTFVHGAVRTTLRAKIPGPFAFADRLHGLALLSPSPPGPLSIYRTSDGGRTWRRAFTLG
jgi:photosystem II stability/assembly factor-like uncharacterized protein